MIKEIIMSTDNNSAPIPLVPAKIPWVTKTIAISTTAVDYVLDVNTQFLEIQADWCNVFMKYWATATIADDGWHERIQDLSIRNYVLRGETRVWTISFIWDWVWNIFITEK